MNRVYLRLYIPKYNRIIETGFDSRFTFYENLKILSNIEKIDLDTMHVYDFNLGIFLKMDVSINQMHIDRFTMFYLL